MKPIIPPKYDIGIILPDNNMELLHAFEPWCNNIYCDTNLGQHYITTEQSNTSFNLSERVLPFNNKKNNDVLVEITNGNLVNSKNFYYINELSSILKDSGEPGEFELDIYKITINQLKEVKI